MKAQQATISQSWCQHCIWKDHPQMMTGYCLSHHTCDKCGRTADCALVKVEGGDGA